MSEAHKAQEKKQTVKFTKKWIKTDNILIWRGEIEFIEKCSVIGNTGIRFKSGRYIWLNIPYCEMLKSLSEYESTKKVKKK